MQLLAPAPTHMYVMSSMILSAPTTRLVTRKEVEKSAFGAELRHVLDVLGSDRPYQSTDVTKQFSICPEVACGVAPQQCYFPELQVPSPTVYANLCFSNEYSPMSQLLSTYRVSKPTVV